MEYLLDFMERNKHFAKKQIDKLGLHGYEKYKRMWIDLAEELNKRGKKKTVEKWIQVCFYIHFVGSTFLFR